MNQSSSNSDMAKSTAEALKQIQKQGLSISIIGGNNSKTFSLDTATKETRSKQNANTIEKLVIPTRSTVSTENKPTVSQARQTSNSSVETRSSVAQSALSANQPGNANKSNPIVSVPSDSKTQNTQRLSNPSTLETKNLAFTNRISQIEKGQTSTGLLSQNSSFTDSKTPNSGNVKNISTVLENKTPNRVGQTESKNQVTRTQNQSLTTDSKTFASQSKLLGNSPPLETKSLSNQVRLSQTSSTPILNKSISGQRSQLQTSFDLKATNSQSKLLQGRQIDVRTITTPKGHQSLKVLPRARGMTQVHPNMTRSSTINNNENASEVISSRGSTMPIPKTALKRGAVTTSTPSSPAKRKCVKITSECSEQSGSQSDINALSSDESPVKEKKVFSLKTLTPGLTITPIQPTTSTPSTSGTSKKVGDSNQNLIVICPSCKQCSVNLSTCDSCHANISATSVRYQFKNAQTDTASIVVTQNVTTSIEKSMQIFYQFPGVPGQNPSFQFQQSQKVIKVSPRKGRPKRRFVEPVCYTLSSDDDEGGAQFDPMLEEENSGQLMYPQESEGSKSDHSSTSDIMQDENQDFEEPEYPGVTSIGSKHQMMDDEEEEEEEEIEHEMESGEEMMDEELEPQDFGEEDEEIEEEEGEEDEEIPPDEEERPVIYNKLQLPTSSKIVLPCRSIRIGSYKIHPDQNTKAIMVWLTANGITFPAPLITDAKKCMQLTLKASETTRMWIHFGKCLPIIFAYTSQNFGEAVRKALNMTKSNIVLFDPTSEDMRKNKLTFLIDGLTDEQKTFMRHVYPGQEKLKEIDQKEANEILVKSTPQQALIKIESTDTQAAHLTSIPSSVTVIPTNLSSTLSITKVQVKPTPPTPPVPVTKILTYPPPPQTGGIAINTADLATLEEGEFLNDAILDFYLKYVFYEKLTNHDREKTHIFSSFFYPRLTQKPDRQRPGDEVPKTMQVRRHGQVRTWTKHVDIFSKDYIIIPVNQHNHWFLAFVCYPGHVPDVPLVKPETKTNKTGDNVTSTDEQVTSKVIIREEIVNSEDAQSQDDNSALSNSFYEVEEPPDSDEASSEVPDSSTHPDGSMPYPESTRHRRETPCILIFDSLSGPNRWRIASTLREYLEIEWNSRKGTKKVFDRNTMQGFMVKCPQQTNFSDCGLYVLQYVESFFENPIPYFANPMPDLTKWFSDTKISKKRQQLKELILNLEKKNQVKQANPTPRKANQTSTSSPTTTPLQTDNR